MVIARYFDMFIIFSFCGWVYECIFCTIKTKHWQNRGFLWGPICPIYGVGVTVAVGVFGDILPYVMKGTTSSSAINTPVWQIFLFSAVGSAILEFTTSYVLEKCFHAVWWDYSNLPLNIQGRICLPITCCFGLAGVAIVKLLVPWLETLPTTSHPLVNELLSLVFAFLFGMDTALTVASLSKLIEAMEQAQKEFNDRIEAGVVTIQAGPAAVGRAVSSAARESVDNATLKLRQTVGRTAAIAKEHVDTAAAQRVDKKEERMLAAANAASQEEQEKAIRESAEKSFADRMESMSKSWSSRERYHFRSIRQFRSSGTSHASEKIRDMLKGMSERNNKVSMRKNK